MKINKLLLSLSFATLAVPALAYGPPSNIERSRAEVRQQESAVRQQKQIVEQQMRILRQQESRLEELRRKLRFEESHMRRGPGMPPPHFDNHRPGYPQH